MEITWRFCQLLGKVEGMTSHVRSCLSTLSRRRISWVKALWKALSSPLSCKDGISPLVRHTSMKKSRVSTAYISELDQTNLAQGVDDLAANFVGNVQLHHTHVRRAERSIPCWSHGDDARAPELRGFEGKGNEWMRSWVEAWNPALRMPGLSGISI